MKIIIIYCVKMPMVADSGHMLFLCGCRYFQESDNRCGDSYWRAANNRGRKSAKLDETGLEIAGQN